MDKAGKDFLINDELERHLESMYNALGEIDSRQEGGTPGRSDHDVGINRGVCQLPELE